MEWTVLKLLIEPRTPDQNAFSERFNKTYRDEVLDAYVFDPIEQVREVTEAWPGPASRRRSGRMTASAACRPSCAYRGNRHRRSLLLNRVLAGRAHGTTTQDPGHASTCVPLK
jgi:hypothetical protein